MSAAPHPDPLALVRDALAAEPAGVLSDIDGTLAPIVDDPAAVRLAEGAGDALAELARRLAVVGLVTGRAAADARRILGDDRLLVAGNHGIEWLEPGAPRPSPAPGLDGVPAALDALLAGLHDLEGVTVEHKGLSATVHYRLSADPAAAREVVLAALEAARPAAIQLREGRMSVELRPAGGGDKGTATRAVVERYGLRGLVVLGDDLTDLDMFRAAAALRDEGRLRAAILAVGGTGEVPPAVSAAADASVSSPQELVRLLAGLGR